MAKNEYDLIQFYKDKINEYEDSIVKLKHGLDWLLCDPPPEEKLEICNQIPRSCLTGDGFLVFDNLVGKVNLEIINNKHRVPSTRRITLTDMRSLKGFYVGSWVEFTVKCFGSYGPSDNIKPLGFLDGPFDPQTFRIIGLVTDVEQSYRNIYVTVRTFNHHGKPTSSSVPYKCVHPVEDMFHVKWLFRHKFARIRRHINNWREHLAHKPNSSGFKKAKLSFETLANQSQYASC